MTPACEVVEDTENPGDWRVEAMDEDGEMEIAIFHGREARSMAEQHAALQYGWRPKP